MGVYSDGCTHTHTHRVYNIHFILRAKHTNKHYKSQGLTQILEPVSPLLVLEEPEALCLVSLSG